MKIVQRLFLTLGLFATTLVLVGCDAGDLVTSGSGTPVEAVAAPASLEAGALALSGPNGVIHVGDSQDAAEKVFPAPPTAFFRAPARYACNAGTCSSTSSTH